MRRAPQKNRGATFSPDELIDAYEAIENDGFPECVAKVRRACKFMKPASFGPLTALMYLFEQKNAEATDQFLQDLEMKKGKAKTLLARIDELLAANAGRIHENVRNALIVITWQAYVRHLPKLAKAALAWEPQNDFPEI